MIGVLKLPILATIGVVRLALPLARSKTRVRYDTYVVTGLQFLMVGKLHTMTCCRSGRPAGLGGEWCPFVTSGSR
jgi:hypothetical protein